ncbi:unnamed protein product [Rotaria sordida]|uniref:Tetratricopeptide repeat protein 27 n=1 Tax=Rotaria sordida TaxID=392033 RepID=A0A814AZ23_9BILA|nr:unnamed protein product [Rotaria sordida]CAF0919620.1 unnamed protein product [Rotaria sordida]CAF3493325.1 unnamed protein product [Rotaria sordida]CAF3544588.1 unnamed protein product [Rotaria sordida]
MKISQQTWNDLLMTTSMQNVTQVKYIDNEWLNELVHFILNGSYDKLFIEYPNLRDFINKNHDDSQSIEIMNKLNHDEELIDFLHILIGIAYLQLFIINNFLGPKIELDNFEQSISQTTINDYLTCDGETPVSTVEHLDYLFQAIKVFNIEQNNTNKNWTWYWWTMRTLFTHQKMLEERTMTLCNHIQICIDKLLTYQSEMNKIQQILFFIEITYISEYYYNWKQAETSKNRALEISGLEINLTGQLGKRTRYQINNTSQLLLDIKRKELQETSINNNITNEENLTLPKNLALNDDVVLNQIQFQNETDYQDLTVQLNIIEQLTLLLIIYDRQINNPRHEITTEEQLAFLNYILARPINWCIQTCSLTLRCQHETDNKRKIERTLLQLQELIDQYDYKNPSSSFRLEYFHSTPIYPTWKLKSYIAHVYVKLGLINNALDLYLYLKKWSDVITCYQLLKKLSLAEHIIREQLKIKETPDLLCSLGEVTDEFEYFERAWILSKERNGRAQRLMGKYYFNRGNYEKACDHLLKAVEINSLQHDIWFWLGSAAFRTEKWELGVRAYHRCTNIEPDNFEAWNNLAACHTKLKQKDKAHKVFLEAIKCNYDNWKVWENFLWTSADCGETEDVIQAYHRLIDLKTKYMDKEVLQRLVHLLSENNQNEIWTKIYQKSLELFGRLTSQVTNDADIWELYSDLCQLKKDNTSIDWHMKILQQLQRAHRCATSQTPSWESEINTIKNVLKLSNKLATNTIEKLNEHSENENFKQLCHSIRLALNSVMTRLKQKYDSSLMITDEKITDDIQQLEKSISQLTNMLLKN